MINERSCGLTKSTKILGSIEPKTHERVKPNISWKLESFYVICPNSNIFFTLRYTRIQTYRHVSVYPTLVRKGLKNDYICMIHHSLHISSFGETILGSTYIFHVLELASCTLVAHHVFVYPYWASNSEGECYCISYWCDIVL